MRTKIIGLLGFGIAVGLVGPVNSEEIWVKTADQDCLVQGDEALKSNEIVTWSGSCESGRASGVGKMEWIVDNKLAGIYEGRMTDGKLEGKGILRLEVEKAKALIDWRAPLLRVSLKVRHAMKPLMEITMPVALRMVRGMAQVITSWSTVKNTMAIL
jgi:hypothetical protein